MKTLKQYWNFLIKEDVSPEAPQSAAFGQFMFAPSRQDLPDPKEPNTREEDQVFAAVEDYFHSNVKSRLAPKADLLLKLKDQGYYKNILDPNRFPYAWRVLNMDQPAMADMLKLDYMKLPPEGTAGPGVLKPNGPPISGWTVDVEMIKDFPTFGRGDCYIIYKAPIKNNKFFGNPGEFALSIGAPEFVPEMETLAYGPVSYEKAAYVVVKRDDNLNQRLMQCIELAR